MQKLIDTCIDALFTLGLLSLAGMALVILLCVLQAVF
jgi:hypothetical protein